jgi:murein tripeptide amidase MpaA
MDFVGHPFVDRVPLIQHSQIGKKVVVHHGCTIKKGRLINVTRCRVAGSDVSVARAANLPSGNGKFDAAESQNCRHSQNGWEQTLISPVVSKCTVYTFESVLLFTKQ